MSARRCLSPRLLEQALLGSEQVACLLLVALASVGPACSSRTTYRGAHVVRARGSLSGARRYRYQ